MAMEAFRQGNFQEKILYPSVPRGGAQDDIDRLGATYNEMVECLLRQMRELQRTDAVRRDLIANVSHDLRTPLASLRGYLETLLLKEGSLAPEERRNYLETASRQSENLAALVSELFELATLDARDAVMNPEPFPVAELVQDVLHKFQLAAQRRQVCLRAELAPEIPFVRADIGLIERVLANLIENALRHTPPGGSITLTVAPGNGPVSICVSDTGSGIPRDELPFIFERFYRVDKSRDSKSGGAGLGLAIAKRILDLHGSAISVQSAPGSGTSFRFDLPVASARRLAHH